MSPENPSIGKAENPKLDRNHFLMPDSTVYQVKRDRYQRVRGEPKMLEIDCASCATPLFVYQKDGPGSLLRCYLDRIAWVQKGIATGTNLDEQVNALHKEAVKCPHCTTLIGTPMVYEKEDRSAVRMFPGKFAKKKYEIPPQK